MQRYERLELLGVLTDKDMYEKGSQRLTKSLDIPIRVPSGGNVDLLFLLSICVHLCVHAHIYISTFCIIYN